MSVWVPDVCPDQSAPCEILTVGGAGGAFVKFETKCAFHSVRAGRDQEIYDGIISTNRDRETARAAAKSSLGLSKEHPGVWYRTEPDGSYTLGVNGRGDIMPEWPKDQAGADKLRDDIAKAR